MAFCSSFEKEGRVNERVFQIRLALEKRVNSCFPKKSPEHQRCAGLVRAGDESRTHDTRDNHESLMIIVSH